MSLSVAIMAHPARERFAAGLARKLPAATVVWDEHNDRWDTGRRALLAHDPTADHHLVVQDDALLCKDFLAGAQAAAEAADQRPVGLYLGKVRPHRHTVTPAVEAALRNGLPWLQARGPWWGVGIVIPITHIPRLVTWCDSRPQIRNYDRRIARWYERQGVDCWYTVPSLVEHRPVSENPSLVTGRTSNRQAHAFLGTRSARRIDWTLPPVRLRGSRIIVPDLATEAA